MTAVEGDRQAAADLAVERRSDRTASISPVHQSVEEFVRTTQTLPRNCADATVIVDPPRTGMSREALDGVIRLRAGADCVRVVRRRDAGA